MKSDVLGRDGKTTVYGNSNKLLQGPYNLKDLNLKKYHVIFVLSDEE